MGIFGKEPAAIAAAVQAIFGMVVALGWIELTEQQIGMIITALTLTLGLFVRQTVVAVQTGRERQAEGLDPLVPRDKQ